MVRRDPGFMVNIIVEGFTGGGSSSSSQRKYVRQVLVANVISLSLSKAMHEGLLTIIIFSSSDTTRVYSHDNDHMVIIVQYNNSDIK